MELFEIKQVPIFESGKWNGDRYTENDLDDMVKSFEEIGGKIKPFVKLGHNAEQPLLQKDGLPAAGWIDRVYRIGKVLYADIKDIPQKIYELIQKKAYKRISSEIYWGLKDEGKTYRRVLKAVALLGADTPAVTSLDDVISLYTEEDYDEIKICTLEDEMSEEKITILENENKEQREKIEALTKQVEELKTYSDRIEYEKRLSEVESFVERSISEGKIIPAQKDYFMALALDGSTKSYSEKSGSGFEMVQGIVSNYSAVPMGEQSHVVEPQKMSDDDKFDEKIKAYAKEHNMSYSKAYSAVALAVAMEE
jgi:hypothetical protein